MPKYLGKKYEEISAETFLSITPLKYRINKMNNMRKLIACTVAAIAMCTLGYSQSSPSLKAKFRLAEGADLRILNDNIWDYSQDTIPPKWQEIGEDPRDFVRAPQFARLVTDYMPDVLTLQEYSSHMLLNINELSLLNE